MTGSFARIVGAVSVWHVAASMCYYALYVATPYLREGFGASHTEVGIVLGVLSAGYAIALLPVGALMDVHGERRALLVGLAGLSIGTAAIALAPTFAILLPVAFGVGALYATASPGTTRAILVRVPAERRNLGMGIKQVGVTAGSAGSALVLTWFAGTQFGWSGGLLAVAALGIGVTLAFALTYPTVAVGGERSVPSFRGLLRLPAYRLLVVAGIFLGAMGYTTTGYAVLYLTEDVLLAVGLAGVVLAGAQASGSVGRVASGWLADALSGPAWHRTLGILLVQTILAAVLLFWLPIAETTIGVALAFVAAGFFALGLGGIYFSAVGALVPETETGSASAAAQLTLTLGGLVGPPAFGILVDASGYAAGWRLLAFCGVVSAALLIGAYLVAGRQP